jgi:tyrosyl-tRNA synthetase
MGGLVSISKLLVSIKLQSSNGEARRSITQGAVRINEHKITDQNERIALQDGDIVQVGKRKFAKIKIDSI